MANRKQHNADCMIELGETFEYVHKWLDGLAFPGERNMLNINHRRFRHHDEGIEEVRKMWGDKAAEAAEIHIIRDEGYVKTRKVMENQYPEEPEFINIKDLD